MSKVVGGLTSEQREKLERILKLSTDSSAIALSEMADRSITLQSPKIDMVSINSMVDIMGGAEAYMISICLIFEGEANGCILLTFPGKSAFELVGLILQEDISDRNELDEMIISVLGEMGNLVSSYFLSTLSDCIGLDLRPSSPMIAHDMVGASVSSAILMLERAPEDILYVETEIVIDNRKTEGYMLLFTDKGSLETLLRAIEAR